MLLTMTLPFEHSLAIEFELEVMNAGSGSCPSHVQVPLMLSSVRVDEALSHCHPLVRGSPLSFARVLGG